MLYTIDAEERLYSDFCDIIESYALFEHLDRLTYLFSGGKEASIGLDFLQRYLTEMGMNIPLDVVMITYPKHVYFLSDGSPADCLVQTVDYWRLRGIEITVFIPEKCDFADGDADACTICKGVRQSYVDPYLRQLQLTHPNDALGVITDDTLYDALGYMNEILLSTDFNNNDILASEPKVRAQTQTYLHKMKVREVLPNGLTMIRPLINMHEDLILAYLLGMGIAYMNIDCKAAKNKRKEGLYKNPRLPYSTNKASYKGLVNFLESMTIRCTPTR